MPKLPDCDYRVETERRNVYTCRHAGVHIHGNIVTPSVCRSCNLYNVPCDSPRPIPGEGEGTETKPMTFPPLYRQGWNLAKSLATFVADGLKTVDANEYNRRLAVCNNCDQRIGPRCLQCGCNLALKARGRAFDCPIGKWTDPETASDSS